MAQEEILEGNKLIAEFMGGIYSENAKAWGFGDARIEHKELVVRGKLYKNLVWAKKFEKDLKYHSSWDWLIPVINKIYESDWYYKWKDTSGQFEKEVFINTKFIETTWEQVVEFIKWYNENKNK